MKMKWEDSYYRAVRSRLDFSVWVAVIPDSDYECFEHAGSLRKVKAYLQDELVTHFFPDDVTTKWVRVDERIHALYVREK